LQALGAARLCAFGGHFGEYASKSTWEPPAPRQKTRAMHLSRLNDEQVTAWEGTNLDRENYHRVARHAVTLSGFRRIFPGRRLEPAFLADLAEVCEKHSIFRAGVYLAASHRDTPVKA